MEKSTITVDGFAVPSLLVGPCEVPLTRGLVALVDAVDGEGFLYVLVGAGRACPAGFTWASEPDSRYLSRWASMAIQP